MTEGDGGGGKKARSPWSYASLGVEIATPIVLLIYAGVWADGRFGTKPWLTVVGALIGIAVGLYNLFRAVLPPRNG